MASTARYDSALLPQVAIGRSFFQRTVGRYVPPFQLHSAECQFNQKQPNARSFA